VSPLDSFRIHCGHSFVRDSFFLGGGGGVRKIGSLNIILRSAHTAVFMCFVWISEQTAIISLYNIN